MTTVTIDKDQTFRFNLAVKQADGTTAYDLTGCTVKLVIEGNGVLLEKTCTVDSAALGTCHYDLVQSDWASLFEGTFDYAFWIYTGNTDSDVNAMAINGSLVIVDVPVRTH